LEVDNLNNIFIGSLHGGDIYTEGILKGRALLDFSSNINPLGVPKSFTDNLRESVGVIDRYPDIQYRALKGHIIDYLGMDKINEKNLVLGNGAAEIIDLIISCFKKILIVVPSFLEYSLNAQKWGCNIEYSFLNENMELDYEDILRKIKRCDAIIIGNPNNPNGETIEKHSFQAILDYAEMNKKTIIIDEAFIEFTTYQKINYSFQNLVENYKCIFIIKALTKFFSLPGVRFGYGVSSDVDLLNKVREKQNPWNINCFAELAVKYVLKDKEFIRKSQHWIKEEIENLPKRLKDISYIEKVYPTKCNFLLCKLKDISGQRLYDSCLEKGIIIRRAKNFISLSDKYVRFAIKDRISNDSLINVLERCK
jgi:Histidinol-phosphate/aromatic aminotransferase and cobyric acid decarboxylase